MLKITVGIAGMMCGMCEAHTNEAISKAFKVSKVVSSHEDNETIIITKFERLVNRRKIFSSKKVTIFPANTEDERGAIFNKDVLTWWGQSVKIYL